MADEKVLELSVQSFTADKLDIKVKNISGAVLERSLTIELYAPAFLVNQRINDAAKAAATNLKPVGVASLAGVVNGPESWSLWAKRETSDTSVVILLLNDLTQSGNDLELPIKLAAGAEFIIGIPLNPAANRSAVHVLYSYQHGTEETDKRVDGKLELKSSETVEWTPQVSLTTTHGSPTAIKAGALVKIFWKVKDGVSATLRGPLPGGTSELTLGSAPTDDFKIADGVLEVRVVAAMTFILQAVVKRGDGKPDVQVVRMLSLDTKNEKYVLIDPRPVRVLPYGLVEIDWAAWGVKQVQISVSGHTTRTIKLTQQTLGHSYEGSGIMRINATKTINNQLTTAESITIQGDENSQTKPVSVINWSGMGQANLDDRVLGLAVVAPNIAAVTAANFYIAEVGVDDPTPPQEKLEFTVKEANEGPMMWAALTAVDDKFLAVRRVIRAAPELELVSYLKDGSRDEIPPLTLPADIRPIAFAQGAVFDLVGVGARAWFVVETPKPVGSVRRAYSVKFDSKTKKADLRREPLLETLTGFRLVAFDDALFALNRNSGRMFRFDILNGVLQQPKKAASAVKKDGAQEQSMIGDGLLTPVGRLLVVMSPKSVPSVESLEQYGLRNTLRYTSTSGPNTNIPQDLVYNPQRNYWGRCGHDLDIKSDSVVAFRSEDADRLWVIKPDLTVRTLAVGSPSLFAPDYVVEFPTKPLQPYLNKQRKFQIKNDTGMRLEPMLENFSNAGLTDFSADGPCEFISDAPQRFPAGTTETFEFKYNEHDPIPVRLRFLVDTAAGVPHTYMLEVTLSGPDLGTATSVFKRIVVGQRNALDVVEIPGTTQQHSTSGAIVITPPKRLVEGVTLRAQNATTYRLWIEGINREADSYSGEEIRINYNTPGFYILGYGAGELHVNVDFALPPGIEVSPGSEPQRKLVRINIDESKGLHAELLPNTSDTAYTLKISYLRKQEVNGVYIGDGVARERGEAFYVPIARGDIQAVTQVLKVDPDNLSLTPSTTFQPPGQAPGSFATPNSIAISQEFVYAMWGDTEIHVLDFQLQLQDKVNVGDVYQVITGIKCAYEREYFLLGIKKDKTNVQNISFHHLLSAKSIVRNSSGPRKIITSNNREVLLDAVKGFNDQNKMSGFPAWVSSRTVSPMALSDSLVSREGDRAREVAVAIDGGLFVVGNFDKNIRTLALESARREEDIVFGRLGKHIYCLHSESDNRGLRLSRVDNVTWKQTHSLALKTSEAAPDLTTDTRQRQPGIYKNHRSISMVRTLDDKYLFVSHGRSIFKIDAAKLELRDTYKVELPCRVFHVWEGKPSLDQHQIYGNPGSCILLYAIGANYRGDGIQGKEFKTQLYKLAIPDR